MGAPIKQHSYTWLAWIGLAIVIGAAVFGLRFAAPLFGQDINPNNYPIMQFSSAYVLLGLLFVIAIVPLIQKTQQASHHTLILFILLIAVLLRLGLQGVPSILEDDYNRYLWDGAVTASWLNPYSFSPEQILDLRQQGGVYDMLIKQSEGAFARINYPEFSTVYPPAAQAIFAISYWISPFDIDALRLVFLALELGCIAFILLILSHLGKSLLWVSVYAWNPLVIKEISNSVHMEPILMLPVLFAIYCTLKQRVFLASAALAIAAGVKIWPALLVVVIWRQMTSQPVKLIQSGLLFGLILSLMISPVLLAGLTETSGFVAFGGQWQASSAAYIISEWVSYAFAPLWVEDYIEIPLFSRLVLAVILLTIIAYIVFRKAINEADMVWRMFLITASIYLLAPSHTPWYFIWIAPFLCFFPSRGLLFASALIPMHYSFFYLQLHDLVALYDSMVIWTIWLPVWAIIFYEIINAQIMSKNKQVLA